MDHDSYSPAPRDEGARLPRLGRQRLFSGREGDELIGRYHRGATQLSPIKTSGGSPARGDRLSVTLSRARMRFTGASTNVLSQIPRFFVLQLPAALYRIRWLTLAVALVTIVIATCYGVWVSSDPRVLASLGPDEDLRKYANDEFVAY